ncbi:pre-tRNA nuclear export protein [Lecanora helva]
MDAQVQSAIECAWDPRGDQTLKHQAFDFLNQLRSEPQGWQICFSLAVRDPRASEVVRHVSLDIVNNAIKAGQLNVQDLNVLKDNLFVYIQSVYGAGRDDSVESDPLPIQNKITQTITNLFTALYTTHWTSFFNDVLILTSTDGSHRKNNQLGVLLYLRILISVHDEIADVLLLRTPEEQRKHNDLKDLVRQRDAVMIAASWHEIIGTWSDKDDSIIKLCLTTIGRWVTWTDVGLAVNNSLLQLLFEYIDPQQNLKSEQVAERKDAAIEAFIDILGKKMTATDKLELIEVLKIYEAVSRLVRSRELSEMRSTANYDTDLAECVAKLVNNTVTDIVKALDNAQNDELLLLRGNVLLKSFMPHILRFLSDEYDEICSTVIPCLTDLLTLLRRKAKAGSSMASEISPTLPLILDVVITKLKYDETSYWGHEDTQTDEAEFQELRKRLHNLQKAVAAVDESMFMNKITTVVVSTFAKYQDQSGRIDWRELELALHEMELFGESAFKHGGLYSKTKPVTPVAEQLIEMMSKLVQTDIASFAHPAVQLQYMVICERYHTFFEHNPQHIAPALENFIRLVHHDHLKVKMRSWYLFHRYVKHVRQHVGSIAETIIQALNDLLPIRAELGEAASDNDDEDISSSGNNQSANAQFDSQLYLYETVGCITSVRSISIEKQATLVTSVLSPLFSDLEAHLPGAKSGDKQSVLQVHHLIMALGTLARGFADGTPTSNLVTASPPANAVSAEFARAAEAVLMALEGLRSLFEIREAARFAFNRLIAVVGNRILPQLPRWIDGLLSETSTKDEMAMFMKLLDQVVFGFKSEIYSILNTLLSPFLQRVFAGIAEPVIGTDDEIQLTELKREYLGFLLVVLNNGLESVLVSEANQSTFTTVISTIEHFTKDIRDFQTAKLAFSVLSRMVLTWGGSGSETSVNGVPLSQVSPHSKLPGFDRYMMTTFSPLCWAIPSNPNFDPKDAQGKQVLGEAAALQKAIFTKTGDEYLNYLRDVELSGMGMDSGTMSEYLSTLYNADTKAFQQFFKVNLSSHGPCPLCSPRVRILFNEAVDELCARHWMVHRFSDALQEYPKMVVIRVNAGAL